MQLFDRYLFREFAQATFAAMVVLMMVSLGAVFTDVLRDIAKGGVPAGMMLSQLGLQLIRYLPLILPLGMMLGLMLAVGRLYRDSEMPVLTASGVGPKRLLKPVLVLLVPLVAVIAACSLWLGPWAQRTSNDLLVAANRSVMVAGLEPGRFIELPGGGGVVYVGAMSKDGTALSRVFIYRLKEGRLDVTTARTGRLVAHNSQERYLTLDDGFRVEGPAGDGKDYRLMRYRSNDVRMPEGADEQDQKDPEALPTAALFSDPRPEAVAELHYRFAPPLLALAFGLLAVPLARSSPRQARYGRVMLGFLAYVFGMNLMLLGKGWLEDGKIPLGLGLWWLVLPVLGIAAWMYLGDGKLGKPRKTAQAQAA